MIVDQIPDGPLISSAVDGNDRLRAGSTLLACTPVIGCERNGTPRIVFCEVLGCREDLVVAPREHVVALIVELLTDDTPQRHVQTGMPLVTPFLLPLPKSRRPRIQVGDRMIYLTVAGAGFEISEGLIVFATVVTENSDSRHAGDVAQIPVRPIVGDAGGVVIDEKVML